MKRTMASRSAPSSTRFWGKQPVQGCGVLVHDPWLASPSLSLPTHRVPQHRFRRMPRPDHPTLGSCHHPCLLAPSLLRAPARLVRAPLHFSPLISSAGDYATGYARTSPLAVGVRAVRSADPITHSSLSQDLFHPLCLCACSSLSNASHRLCSLLVQRS